jgi:hypothetical protein
MSTRRSIKLLLGRLTRNHNGKSCRSSSIISSVRTIYIETCVRTGLFPSTCPVLILPTTFNQFVQQNMQLKRDLNTSERKLAERRERIADLERSLVDYEALQDREHDLRSRVQILQTQLAQLSTQSHNMGMFNHGRVAKPLRGKFRFPYWLPQSAHYVGFVRRGHHCQRSERPRTSSNGYGSGYKAENYRRNWRYL